LKESHSVINEEALKILVNSALQLTKQPQQSADESDSTMINTNNKFNLGTDGIIIIDRKNNKSKLLTANSYSLTNIEKLLNPNINKKDLLEQLCTSDLKSSKKDCYKLSNIELFYNEGFAYI
jgi:hypothetical protein